MYDNRFDTPHKADYASAAFILDHDSTLTRSYMNQCKNQPIWLIHDFYIYAMHVRKSLSALL